MAQKYLVQIVDDLDGTELDRNDVEEVHFSLDGRAYVIDLSRANADKLRDAFGTYTEAARRDQATGRTSTASSIRSTGEKRKDLDQVRQWANANNHPVSSRGRIPGAVLQAYDAAH